MEIKVSIKDKFEDGLLFLEFLKKDTWKDYLERTETDIKDLDYLDGKSLIRDNPKVIQMKEIFEPKIFNKMKEYFVKNDKDITKRNIRSYISGYNKLCSKPVVPLYYFFSDEDLNNLLIEWFENDLGELLISKTIGDDFYTETFHHYDIFFQFTDDFYQEMLSSDIQSMRKKIMRLC